MRLHGEISREQYDAYPGVRWSMLSHMRKSPAHYQHALTHPRTATSALNKGSALHTLVFEPETYAERFTTYTASKSKGEGARKAWEAFQVDSQARHLIILDAEEVERAEGMAAAVRSKASAYIAPSKGRAEIPITWTDTETGLVCKSRLDWLTINRVLVELKSTRSTDERNFANQAWKLGYFHAQMFYSMGVAAATGCAIDEVPFLFVAVESEPPYDVALFEPCQESRQAAHEDVKRLMATLADCQRTGKYPGRYDGPRILKAPAYVLMSEDEEWDIQTKEL